MMLFRSVHALMKIGYSAFDGLFQVNGYGDAECNKWENCF